MRTIWYVHGAGASSYSFTFLQQQLKDHQARFFNYSIDQSTASCITSLADALSRESHPVVLIGHSLGGVIARICAQHPKVSHLITLCAPFGGIRGMGMVSLFNRTPIFHDLRTYSSVLENMRKTAISIPHLAIVGTHGMPYTSDPNDGVVSVASQMALPEQIYMKFELNHFEVLLSPEVATTMNHFLP